MGQVTGPIIAITLVLLSVFVPTAFIPGITGQLYKQFAVAVSVSMVISAINALSLSPALCSLLLRHRSKPKRRHGLAAERHRQEPRRLCQLVTPIARRALLALILRAAGSSLGARAGSASWCPRASCPTRTRAPSWPRCSCPTPPRPTARGGVASRSSKTLDGKPWMQNIFTVTGYSLLDGLALPNRALVVVGAEAVRRAQGRKPPLTVSSRARKS